MDNLQIRFGQVDPQAKGDISSIVSSAIKPWGNVEDLRFDYIVLSVENGVILDIWHIA
jgi:hypothetical protein